MRNTKYKGFTLVELMITLAILAIIAMVAVPTYLSHMRNVRRIDATIALHDSTIRMERYYAMNNTYVGATLAGIGSSTSSSKNYYTIALSNLSATTYTVTATPTAGGPQASDAECTSFIIDQTGTQTVTGTATSMTCWK